jgi:5'-nucleotidase
MLQKLVLNLVIICGFVSCKQSIEVTKVVGQRIAIDSSVTQDQTTYQMISPYRAQLEKSMQEVLSYAKDNYSKTDGQHNTAIGNMMADAVLELTQPVFKGRTQKEIDMVLLNHGGIRSTLPKGPITVNTAYKLMPFENAVVVVEMSGSVLMELITYLQTNQKAHPISGMVLTLKPDGQIFDVKVKGQSVQKERSYYVATSDYLYNGGDEMYFFKKVKTKYQLDYKIRNVLLDYFRKHDTIAPTRDQRFTQQKFGL